MKIIISAISLAYFAGSAAALAQSAEETAAFIIVGAEDGAKISKDGAVAATLAQISKTPATFVFSSPNNQPMFEVSVRQIAKCRFEITANKSSEPSKSGTYDFNKLSTVSFAMGYGFLTFAGSCAVKGMDGICTSSTTTAQLVDAPSQRVMKAIDYMKATYCPGSAF